jgi:hypothetical protein
MSVTLALFLMCVLPFFLALFGCDRAANRFDGAERLGFSVSDSLLGERVVIERANKALRAPAGFEGASDSLFAALQGIRLRSAEGAADAELVAALFDTAHRGGLTATVLPGITHQDDDYIRRYEGALREVEGHSDVRAGDYLVNDVYVSNFLVTDSAHVRFQLLCFSEGDEALELVYFARRQSYPDLVRAFESSIGTIEVLRKGG